MGAAASLLFFLSVLGRYQPTPPRWHVGGLTHTVLAARVKGERGVLVIPERTGECFECAASVHRVPLLKLVKCFKLNWEHILQTLKSSQQRIGASWLQRSLSNRFSPTLRKPTHRDHLGEISTCLCSYMKRCQDIKHCTSNLIWQSKKIMWNRSWQQEVFFHASSSAHCQEVENVL